MTAIGCVDTVGSDPAMDFDTETGDEHPTIGADGVTLEPSEETGDGDGDLGDGDSGDGDSGDGDSSDDDSSDGDSSDGDMSDTGETGDVGFCGDGIVDPDEECDMDIAKFGPCADDLPGLQNCQLDCTFDDSFCDCVPGTEGCLCDLADDCEQGLACVGDGLMLCEECVERTRPCNAGDFCCNGSYCGEGPTGELSCQ